MEGGELQHLFHEHPLILKAKEHKTSASNDDPEVEINCDGCFIPISGPFYSCGECHYFLHKVCAELPSALDHPLHPKHPLTLLPHSPDQDGYYSCDFCKKEGSGLFYYCSVCSFVLDIRCAFPTYLIKDKCHPHPLTPVQVPIALACHVCRVQGQGLFYKCDICPFLVHQNCTTEHSNHDHPYPFSTLQHFSHQHPLILKVHHSKNISRNNHQLIIKAPYLKKFSCNNHPLILKVQHSKDIIRTDHSKAGLECGGCPVPISSGPYYSCGECRYFLHKVCGELPSEVDHPLHPQHPLELLKCYSFDRSYRCNLCGISGRKFYYHCSNCNFNLDMVCASATHKIKVKWHPHPLTPLQVSIAFFCHICRKKEEDVSYKCYSCPFWVHQTCTLQADIVEHSHHDHPYPLRVLRHFLHDHPLILIANDDSNVNIQCYGCRIQILGPFYSCGECRYFLHKVCAELPDALDHPMHSQHSLTLKYWNNLGCSLCRKKSSKVMGYTCPDCEFYLDMKCASATHVIQEKCHPHPLIPVINVSISVTCHICLLEEKGLFYKCNSCPFWVHQNCTLLPDTVKHTNHGHVLKLFPSIPFEYKKVSEYCDICHSELVMFQCIYGCDRCKFFAHAICARSETIPSPSESRDQNTDGQSIIRLPMEQDSTDLISWFVRNIIDKDAKIDNHMDHFDHEHPLLLTYEKTNDKTCEACAIRISAPSYSCVDCDYFLHKCCADLPKQIRPPQHPNIPLTLQSEQKFRWCHCCCKYCNSFSYKCPQLKDFRIDIKCATILQGAVVYHEAHKHPLIPKNKSLSTICTACGSGSMSKYNLECSTCNFKLCFKCAMAPRVIKHRYGKSEPFRLTYSPPENHFDEYICEICLRDLNPKHWFYHCGYADQFTHIMCLVNYGADSNIKYGKSHMSKKVHEHELTTIRCTYDCTPCSKCRRPLKTAKTAFGLECKTCHFKIHLYCP